ncbi:hypothetical protein Vafri_8662 [Volvox africanus]|uniref:Uncharacterized protein n=1 Tax=Volvox africanus TaxID=51714 RepID=A0A8J4B2Q7_9CHLO|nr:hypothetical protein Vafri_8662 [Volvox africanus]
MLNSSTGCLGHLTISAVTLHHPGPSESSSVGPSGGASGDKVPYWEVLLEHVPGLTRDQRERAKQRLIQEHPTEAIRQSYLLFPEEARRHVLKLIGDWNTYVELCSWLFGTPFNQCSESPSPKPGAPHGSLSESISVGPSGGPSESSSAGPSGGASGDKMPYWEVLLEHVPGLTRDQRERAKQHLIREHPTEGARVLHLIFPAEARRHILMLLGEWNVYVELCYWLFGTSNNQCSESPSPKPGGPHDSPSESPFGSPCRGASEGPIYNMQPAVGQRLGNPKAHLHQRKVYSGVLQT